MVSSLFFQSVFFQNSLNLQTTTRAALTLLVGILPLSLQYGFEEMEKFLQVWPRRCKLDPCKLDPGG